MADEVKMYEKVREMPPVILAIFLSDLAEMKKDPNGNCKDCPALKRCNSKTRTCVEAFEKWLNDYYIPGYNDHTIPKEG